MKKNLLFFVVLPFFIFGQTQDFKNDYTLSQCNGEIPFKLAQTINDKVSINVKGDTSLTKRNQRKNVKFYESSNYYLENLLRSGKVLFGDEMTDYVQSLTDLLLTKSNKEELKKYISVFVIKSEDVNAFAMQDGSIFITVGLLAQVENEAELAFVLAHEIAHFEKRHGVEIFNERMQADKNLRRGGSDIKTELKRLSNYSKSSEFEADEAGYKTYKAAGYNPMMALQMLEVLKYSHLPFDNLKFDKTYFNSKNYKIPLDYFKTTKSTYDIETNEADIKFSSHPNIDLRIDRLDSLFSPEENSRNYYLGKNKFNLINTKARFENLYLGLIGKKFVRVIYETYLLEKIYPDNKYLKKCTVLGLYGISKLKLIKSYITDNKYENYDKEGEILPLNSLLINYLSDEELMILAISKFNELNNKELNSYKLDLMSNLVHDLKFDYKKLFVESHTTEISDKKFSDSVGNFKQMDSLEYLKLTKVEKINYRKEKKKWEDAIANSSKQNNKDTVKLEKYYVNIFSNLTEEDQLYKDFEEVKNKRINRNVWNGKRYFSKKVNLDSIAILEPVYLDYKTKLNGRKEVFYVESIEKKQQLNNSINRVSNIYDKHIFNLNSVGDETIDIRKLNIDFLIKEWYNEVFENEDLDMLTFSQLRVDSVFDKINCENMMILVIMDDRVRRKRTSKFVMFLNRNGVVEYLDYIETKKKGQRILNEMFINDVFSKITKK